ncbi:ABC transporter ATP-binding protein [Rhodopila globiformis]|uniref:ABC transporter ATP-binding protein n=1 Tax=Rhodopila globiformis TaxID=1071 RepID=A0A2S6NNM2_RHOGL|nr:ATP-binding cassette domain-containing protein [Rhodopila globiformis]PPQ39023.1 ABC transporter ATP-binding protein [Rhodopila globiformis]
MLLEVAGLSRSFGRLRVIEDLSLSVQPGEVLGIIGPNGAGKSTLFNLIAGVLPPTAGTIRLSGRDITGLPPWDRCRLGIGRTYQVPRPFAHMSVFENVLVAAVHGSRASLRQGRRRAEAVLALAGLAAQQARTAGALTLLDLKRLELCKALAVAPKLLLLDEIAGGLTEPECATLIGIVRRAQTPDMAVVWIEHVVQTLRRIATRLAVLHDGGVLAEGAPDAVLANSRVQDVYLGTEGR